MAKKKPPQKEVKPVKTDTATRKPMVVQVRGSEEWKTWAEELADRERDTLAKLVERALSKWARDAGFREPPRR